MDRMGKSVSSVVVFRAALSGAGPAGPSGDGTVLARAATPCTLTSALGVLRSIRCGGRMHSHVGTGGPSLNPLRRTADARTAE